MQQQKDSILSCDSNIPQLAVRGGGFLCNKSYCQEYRVSARMKSSPDSGLKRTGFRFIAAR